MAVKNKVQLITYPDSLGGDLKTGVKKEFAALEKDIFGKPKYIQEATYVKSPSAKDWQDVGANKHYDWGQGYYA